MKFRRSITQTVLSLPGRPVDLLCLALGAALALGGTRLWSAWKEEKQMTRPVEPAPATAPWGRLQIKTLLLEKPPELLPATNTTWEPTRWCFAGRTREATRAFLRTCDLTDAQLTSLCAPELMLERADGCWVTPAPQTVLSLSRSSREKIYTELETSPRNVVHQHPFSVSQDEAHLWFTRVGLPTNKVALLRQMTYRRGQGLSFCDTEIARHFLEPGEFHAMLRALACTYTVQIQLCVSPGDPVEKLAAYWARGDNAVTVRKLLESLAKVPGGGQLDVEELLPPLPRTWLYTYPQAGGTGQPAGDCFWTSLNFFRADSEPRYLDPEFRSATFRREYAVVPQADQLGDIILFVDAKGIAQHACTFIAAGIVFTKNGAQFRHPWVLMRMEDVRAIYQSTPPGREMVFRRRSS